jgi:hypothetical protein
MRYRKLPKPRCHTTHNPLKLGMGEVLGGACSAPREGYDIYIGFDYGMKMQHQPFPWDQVDDPIVEFQYHITDMCAPKSPKDFRKMIEWCSEQLGAGKKIHVGCIGGHGRTGTFLAALVSLYEHLTDDPIAYVREHHCEKAVESESQIKFLCTHFGCKTSTPTKPKLTDWHGKIQSKKSGGLRRNFDAPLGTTQSGRITTSHCGSNVVELPRTKHPEKIHCLQGKGSIWG